MFARKVSCPKCSTKVKSGFDFCPHCGSNLRDPQQELDDFGYLGKNENSQAPMASGGSMGITDRMIASMVNALMKSVEKQLKQADPDMQNLQGITINVGNAGAKPKRQKLPAMSQTNVDRMKGLPRVEAASNVRRLGDKVVYELDAPGVQSVNDVFVAKLASGYEVKAIGKNKVYVTSLPVELPLKSYSVEKDGLTFEFGTQ